GLVGDGSGAAGDGVQHVLAAVLRPTGHGEEQIPRTHFAAVQGQLADQDRAFGLRQQLIEWHWHQRGPLAVVATAFGAGSGTGKLSGATFNRRSAPAMTLPNTGADTRPP